MRSLWIAVVAVGLVACGDPETTDTRGYTKAPLENPGVIVDGEEATVMAELGTADRPRPRLLEPEPTEPAEGQQGGQQAAGQQAAGQQAAGQQGGGQQGGGQQGGQAMNGGGQGGEAAGAGGVSLAAGVTQGQFDQGKQLYSGSGCVACHGPDAGGSQLGPNLRDDEWLHISQPTVDAIAGVIRSGVSNPKEYPAPMPAMGGANLSPDELQALSGYLASIAGG